MKTRVIGIDIGGTKVAAGIVDQKGKILEKAFYPTMAGKGLKDSLNQVYLSIEQMISRGMPDGSMFEGIGVCAPGPLDPLSGIVHNPPNLKGWKNVPLRDLLEKRFKKPVKVENDANAAAMAEHKWGSAMGYRHILYVTVSTGIGTGILIDGKIYHGKNGMAGEGGHVTINYDDNEAVCVCGTPGCIEKLASGVATSKKLAAKIGRGDVKGASRIKKACGGKLEDLDMRIIGDAALSGDRLAISTIREQGTLIGIWLGGMISVLDPEIIVIGGGVSLLGQLLLDPIRKTIPRNTINTFASRTPVVAAKLSRDVGIYGAASIMF